MESVAGAAELKDVLSTPFWMLTLYLYAGYVAYPGRTRYFLTVSAFALGLMAKPMLVTLPFVLMLLDYWPLGRYGVYREKGETDGGSIGRKRVEPEQLPSHRLIL